MLDEKLSRDLESTLGSIRGHFLYTDELNDRALLTLNDDAISHSDKLEIDTSSESTLLRLRSAWRRSLEEFDGTVTDRLVLTVAEEIDPDIHGYRRTDVHIPGKQRTYVMTNHAKIEREMGKLLSHVNDAEINPLQRALELHLYFAIIHPLADGNGRTSRLLQNLLLYHHGIPPVNIRHTERPTYLDHIEDALNGFRERSGQEDMFQKQSDQELRFLRYLQGKVNDGAEWLEQRTKRLRRYEVEVDLRGSPQTIYGIRNVVRKALVAQGLTPSVEVNRDRMSMTIVTEQSEEFLLGLLAKYQGKSDNLKKYHLKETTHCR